MTQNRVKLTKASVAAIDVDPARQVLVWDTEIRGFGLRVAPGGAKAYIMQRRVGPTTRRITIGRADDMSAEAARKRATILAAEFAGGSDPVKTKRAAAQRATTLRQAMETYVTAPKKKGAGKGGEKKARTQRDIRVVMQRKFGDESTWIYELFRYVQPAYRRAVGLMLDASLLAVLIVPRVR